VTLILPMLIRVTLKDGKMPAFVRWTIPCWWRYTCFIYEQF